MGKKKENNAGYFIGILIIFLISSVIAIGLYNSGYIFIGKDYQLTNETKFYNISKDDFEIKEVKFQQNNYISNDFQTLRFRKVIENNYISYREEEKPVYDIYSNLELKGCINLNKDIKIEKKYPDEWYENEFNNQSQGYQVRINYIISEFSYKNNPYTNNVNVCNSNSEFVTDINNKCSFSSIEVKKFANEIINNEKTYNIMFCKNNTILLADKKNLLGTKYIIGESYSR
jgi:hypothetical protein